MEKRHYGAIDGLRMIAAFGIVMMHIRANSNYEITGYLYNRIIPSFTNFVFLFMTVSAFGMCCGYYEKILNNQMNLTDFYGKRFRKILPFFGPLVLLDIIMSPSVASLYEGFADLTLLFGLLPNAGSISVIGVGWFLGLVFVFYLVFPFFCVLLENKRRAWMAFGISLIYNFVCANYFNVGGKISCIAPAFSWRGINLLVSRGDREAEPMDYPWTYGCRHCALLRCWRKCDDVPTGVWFTSDICYYQAWGSTGEQSYKVLQRHQYGNILVPHGDFSCC